MLSKKFYGEYFTLWIKYFQDLICICLLSCCENTENEMIREPSQHLFSVRSYISNYSLKFYASFISHIRRNINFTDFLLKFLKIVTILLVFI